MPEDVPPPVVLDERYRLGERIGRGGMADVYRAVDLRQGGEVAVKVFRPEVAEAVDPKRIARETRFLTGAQHPTLVSVLDASDPDSPTAYLVMELVLGSDLAHRLDRGVLEPEHARRVAADIADALAVLHAQQLIHRDVKPANILVLDAGADPAAKLADLGIAVGLDETRLTATNTILGTAAYLSPEQVQGRGVGPASDVYALGLVLIESLTGERAYAGGLVEAAVARLNRPPSLPAGASPGLATLLSRMTALDPAARPSAAEVARTLRAMHGAMLSADIPVTAPIVLPHVVPDAVTAELAHVPARSPRRRPRRRAVPIAAVAAAGVVLVSGMALLPQSRAGQVAAVAAPVASSAPPTATPSATPSTAVSGATATDRLSTIGPAALVSHTSTTSTTSHSSGAGGASQSIRRTHDVAPSQAARQHATGAAPEHASKAPGKKAPHAPHAAPAPHRAPAPHGAKSAPKPHHH